MNYREHLYPTHMHLLRDAGFMVSTYVDGREKPYGVYLGSHGGSGATPQQAVKACLKCCNIGRWWHLGGGTGLMAKDVAADILQKIVAIDRLTRN